MGIGMALAYPNMITAAGDTAHPSWRGGALGVYRLWRDGGYAVGPLVFALIDAIGGLTTTFWAAATLLGVSALILLLLLDEAHPELRTKPPRLGTPPRMGLPAIRTACPQYRQPGPV